MKTKSTLLYFRKNNEELMLLYQYENIFKIIQVLLNFGESEPKNNFKVQTKYTQVTKLFKYTRYN